ncbi:NAD-dependent epimerase/dehydratase family protein [Pararhodobacter zhoushanensis]|uniref:NAD-dependent epimerase/dehydratase family protein n=1 Tax=Pararhodobacter zhoushanensis TaxID=2479545 RepID=A0ABT3H4J1_9RHOB|nr:NAD-dependent epimerase/dehydratase family protein [Pararhodobacter zhoushanensis]MCW1934717.1 NAD-dependent epimerase/dehydratase family protein [Pararhodobacter zhoushanensis]
MAQRVFITGVSGFIAKHIALQALEAGHRVTGSLRNLERADEVRAAIAPFLSSFRAIERLDFTALDLTRDDGWRAALTGQDALIHTASPFPVARPRNADEIIAPARDGTRRALTAAADAGVRRVVLTSSCAAVWGQVRAQRPATDKDWTDPADRRIGPYEASKTIAERLAWQIAEDRDLALSTINPGWVLGPPLDGNFGSSVALIRRLLSGKDPALPHMGLPVADVRDIARMHLAALETDASIGGRYLGASGSLWLIDIARLLQQTYPDRKLARREAPNWAIRLLGLVDADVRESTAMLGERRVLDTSRAQQELGMRFVPVETAIKDCAAALVAMGA